MNPRIIELIIEDGDNEAGLDGIALVEMPAHEASFEYFSNDEKPTHYVLSDEEIPQVIQMFHAYGEPQGLLEKEGFTISQVKELGKEEFAILADPNAPSAQDTNEVKYRYKYVGPQDKKNRTFCAEMMRANRVFRIEDIQEMSTRNVNPVGPDGYSIFEWRGSYNCRHRFVQLVYKLDTTIINKGSVRKGVIDENDVPGPNTLTTSAQEAGYAPRTGFSATNPDVSGLSPYVDQVTEDVELKPVLASLPLFESKEDAETMALAIGCKGSHPHTYGDKTLYMPCEKHPVEMAGLEDACWEGYEPIGLKPDGSPNCVPIKEEMSEDGKYVIGEYASYTDYPELIRKNAQSALDFIERTGNPNNCMTQVGKVRAQQLAQGKPISIETVKRMKAYITRHQKDLQSSKSYDDGCGKLAMDAWGGVEALSWVESTINKYEQMAAEKISIDYDDTLSTQRGKELAQRLINGGATLYIISARNDKEGMLKTAKDLGIPESRVYATGSNKMKVEKIKELSIIKHYDNNSDVIKQLGTTGEKFDMIEEEMTFSVFNAEQRLIVGPAMIPDKMIIRRNEITGDIYYVYFTSDTIKKLQQKFMQEKLLDKTNIEHGRKFLNNVDVVESWIIEDEQKDKQQVFGMNYPKGTWMISMKVNDDATWSKVKDGKLKGFSVQGYFLERAKFSSINNDLLEEIKQILKGVK
jgi:hypothetical protein